MPDCIDFSDYKEYKSSHYIGDVQCLRLPKSLHGRGRIKWKRLILLQSIGF